MAKKWILIIDLHGANTGIFSCGAVEHFRYADVGLSWMRILVKCEMFAVRVGGLETSWKTGFECPLIVNGLYCMAKSASKSWVVMSSLAINCIIRDLV